MKANLPNMQMPQDREGLSIQFEVVIPGFPKMIFNSCEGLESEVEVVHYEEGGSMGSGRTARGKQSVGKITFAKGMMGPSKVGGPPIFQWFLDVCDASKLLQKKMIVVTVTNSEMQPLASWKMLNAWPCRWVGPLLSQEVSELTVEHLSFAHEGIIAG